MMRPRPVLSDGVVTLDGHRLDDAAAHRAGEDAEMRRRFGAPRAATLDETRAAIARWRAAWAADGPMFAYAVRVEGALVGGCELRPEAGGVANVSYWIFPAHRGRGYAARALRLLAGAAESLRLEARIEADNWASIRVAVAAGFVAAGSDAEGRVVYAR